MKRNTILKTLAVATIAAIAVQVQAQGLYIKKKSGGTDTYPANVFDKVTPVKTMTQVEGTGDAVMGAKATLQYEKLPDMNTARISHQIFPSGAGFVVVGGRTENFKLTQTAEIYRNGSWSNVSISNAHDGAFSVQLSDGRYMVGGGFSTDLGVGQIKATDIYDPKTQTFSPGPELTSARAQAMAINAGGKVYVSGNWYESDLSMDCYNGMSFTSVGETDGRSNPYMMADNKGNILVFSTMNSYGGSYGYFEYSDDIQLLLGDSYTAATGETEYAPLPFTPKMAPLALPDDARPEDYRIVVDNQNYYFLLVKTSYSYVLYMINMDIEDYSSKFFLLDFINIPSTDDAGNAITWRGGVKINAARGELYIIGASGPVTNQTLHIMTYGFDNGGYTIGSATGFKHNLMSASWTLLADGRLACTGGGINNNFDAQKSAYIFTPPAVIAEDPEEVEEWGVDVHMKDGSTKHYREKELESITTYE